MNNNIMLGLMSSKYTNKKRIQDVYVENMNYCVKRNYDLCYPVSRFDFDVDGIRIVP